MAAGCRPTRVSPHQDITRTKVAFVDAGLVTRISPGASPTKVDDSRGKVYVYGQEVYDF
jgi:hypothetical protein